MAIRSRSYMFVLYPDNPAHEKIINDRLPLYDATWILHDQDVDDDGMIKKAHVHAVVHFQNARRLSGVAQEVGLEENLIEVVNDYYGALRYLVHDGLPNKYQYDPDSVQGNVSSFRKSLIVRREVSETLPVIFSYIDNKGMVSMRDVARFCIENDLIELYCSKNMVIKNYLKG